MLPDPLTGHGSLARWKSWGKRRAVHARAGSAPQLTLRHRAVQDSGGPPPGPRASGTRLLVRGRCCQGAPGGARPAGCSVTTSRAQAVPGVMSRPLGKGHAASPTPGVVCRSGCGGRRGSRRGRPLWDTLESAATQWCASLRAVCLSPGLQVPSQQGPSRPCYC